MDTSLEVDLPREMILDSYFFSMDSNLLYAPEQAKHTHTHPLKPNAHTTSRTLCFHSHFQQHTVLETESFISSITFKRE